MIAVPFDVRTLYVGFSVDAMSIICEDASSDFSNETEHSQNFFLLFAFTVIFVKSRDLRWSILPGFERRIKTVTISMSHTTGRARVARCTAVGQVLLWQVPDQERFCSSTPGQELRFLLSGTSLSFGLGTLKLRVSDYKTVAIVRVRRIWWFFRCTSDEFCMFLE